MTGAVTFVEGLRQMYHNALINIIKTIKHLK